MISLIVVSVSAAKKDWQIKGRNGYGNEGSLSTHATSEFGAFGPRKRRRKGGPFRVPISASTASETRLQIPHVECMKIISNIQKIRSGNVFIMNELNQTLMSLLTM